MSSAALRVDAAQRVLRAVERLWRERRDPWRRLPPELHPRNAAEAYAIQVLLRERLVEARGSVVGWTLALATPPMQALLRSDGPIIGAIHGATVRQSPARVRAHDHVRLGIACHLAFKISRSLPPEGLPHRREAVQRAVGVCAPAIELIDDRGADDLVGVGVLQLVAENTWNAGLTIGPFIGGWDRLDLRRLKGRLQIQGSWIADALGADARDDPIDALTWLANELPRRGAHLRAGDWVATGAIIPTKIITAGQNAQFHLDRFPSVSLTAL